MLIVKDSKKLTEKQRKKSLEIIKKEALDYSVGFIDCDVIDKFNILKATHMSMHKALHGLKIKPEHILVDGDNFTEWGEVKHTCIIKGDNKYYSIAAASIVAKVTRDEYMKVLHNEFPSYDWYSNKGYGTKKHISTLIEEGISPHHRISFLKKILTPHNI
jgi:ribonuclease HII